MEKSESVNAENPEHDCVLAEKIRSIAQTQVKVSDIPGEEGVLEKYTTYFECGICGKILLRRKFILKKPGQMDQSITTGFKTASYLTKEMVLELAPEAIGEIEVKCGRVS